MYEEPNEWAACADGKSEGREEMAPMVNQLIAKLRQLAKYAPHETTRLSALALADEAEQLLKD